MRLGDQEESEATNEREGGDTPGVHGFIRLRYLRLYQVAQVLSQRLQPGRVVFQAFVHSLRFSLGFPGSRRFLFGCIGHFDGSFPSGKSTSPDMGQVYAIV